MSHLNICTHCAHHTGDIYMDYCGLHTRTGISPIDGSVTIQQVECKSKNKHGDCHDFIEKPRPPARPKFGAVLRYTLMKALYNTLKPFCKTREDK